MVHAGMSEAELSRRSKVKQPTIHRIITGESKDPRRSNVEAIAKVFGKTAQDAYDNDQTPIQSEPGWEEMLSTMTNAEIRALMKLCFDRLDD